RVLPGPQADYFAPDALDVLQSVPYVIAQNSDRMGYRLEGPVLTHLRGADITSDATPLGVLQVPASGQPILLMADRQTTGVTEDGATDRPGCAGPRFEPGATVVDRPADEPVDRDRGIGANAGLVDRANLAAARADDQAAHARIRHQDVRSATENR